MILRQQFEIVIRLFFVAVLEVGVNSSFWDPLINGSFHFNGEITYLYCLTNSILLESLKDPLLPKF